MNIKFSILIIGVGVLLSACKKSKTKKQIVGKWVVTEMYTDESDFLLQKRNGEFLTVGCDTLSFERVETLQSEITFNQNESYSRTKHISIKYIDTAATRLQCTVVYADSIIDTNEEGTWRFEGKETLELLANNNNYEGNKLMSISDKAMEWQTDLNC
jgi:hypothetical protein